MTYLNRIMKLSTSPIYPVWKRSKELQYKVQIEIGSQYSESQHRLSSEMFDYGYCYRIDYKVSHVFSASYTNVFTIKLSKNKEISEFEFKAHSEEYLYVESEIKEIVEELFYK